MNRILTRRAFNLPADPWSQLDLATADSARVRPMVDAAISAQAMVAILGPRGAGKTRAVSAALRAHRNAQVVETVRLDKEKLSLGDIQSALIVDLRTDQTESPRRSGEARSRQLRRILGEAADRGPVVLLIDDSQGLNRHTLRGLKRLRELSYGGRAPLLGIVLLGQRDMLQEIDEIRLRSDGMWMECLLEGEARTALQQAVGRACEPGVIDVLAQAASGKPWLDMIDSADQALSCAMAAGHGQVSLVDAMQATNAHGASLKALAQAAGVSQAQIARSTGRSETQVSRVLSGERRDAETQKAISDFLNQKQQAISATGGAR